MLKIRNLLIIAIFLCEPFLVKAQQIKPATTDTLRLSLKQAVDYAQQNSLSVKNAVLDLESAKKQIWEYTAMGLPQINADGNYQNIFKVPSLSLGPSINYGSILNLPADHVLTVGDLGIVPDAGSISLGVKENITYEASVSQLLFSGSYLVGLQATKILKQLSEQALTKSKFDTKSSVSQSYYMVLVSEEGLKILQSSLNLVNKTLKDMQAMHEQGMIEETDVDQIKINQMNIESLVSSTSASAQLAYRLLKFQMGLNLNQPIELTDSLNGLISSKDYFISQDDKFNINNNIDYKIMQTNEQLSVMNLKKEKAAFMPTLTAFYRHQELLNTPQFNFNFPDLLSVSLTVPIFSSGMRLARVGEAKIAVEKASNQRESVQQSLTIAYQQSKINYMKALNDYHNLKQSVDLSKRSYDKTLLKYKEGMSSSLELTQAQNQFLTTESSYYNAVLNFFNAYTTLNRLMETE